MNQIRLLNLFVQDVPLKDNIQNDKRWEIIEHIAQYTAQQLDVKGLLKEYYYLMTKDYQLHKIKPYRDSQPINILPDAFVYIKDTSSSTDKPSASSFLPFLEGEYLIVYAFLSKQGYDIYYSIPAPELKYISIAVRMPDLNQVVVEVADIDTVANKLNLPRIIHDILGAKQGKDVTDDDIENIISELDFQRPFGGYDFVRAWRIVNNYFDTNNPSLLDKVYSIIDSYNKIFGSDCVIYNIETKQFIKRVRQS